MFSVVVLRGFRKPCGFNGGFEWVPNTVFPMVVLRGFFQWWFGGVSKHCVFSMVLSAIVSIGHRVLCDAGVALTCGTA